MLLADKNGTAMIMKINDIRPPVWRGMRPNDQYTRVRAA
jgi:hypothetical protein